MTERVSLEVDDRLFEQVFTVSPLVLIGTRDPDGGYDIAPKHRVVTLASHVGFACRPSHATWRNALRERAFTVSWAGPEQVVMAAAAASPRCEDGEKKTLRGLPTFAAKSVDGVLVEGCHFHLECQLERIIDDLGDDGLVIGRVSAAWADPRVLPNESVGDGERVHDQPLLAYLHPSQFALIDHSTSFPFPKDFHRG